METLIHTAEGNLELDDPYIVEGTRFKCIQKEYKAIYGQVGVITKSDIEQTIRYFREGAKGTDRERIFHITFSYETTVWPDDVELVNE